MSLNRAFPQDIDAERGALASLLLAPNDVRALFARHNIGPDLFYLHAHRLLMETCCAIVDAGRPLELITIARALDDAGNLEKAGGAAYVNELYGFLPSAANVKAYTEILLEKHLRRQTIEIGTRMASDGYEPGDNSLELLAEAHGRIGQLLSRKGRRVSVADSLQEIVDEVREGKDESGLMSTGVMGIDGRLKLFRGDLFIVSAPTSCGKTALASQIAWGNAMAGRRVALYPLEMAQKRILKRAIAQLGGNNADFVRKTVQAAARGAVDADRAKQVVDDFMTTARTIKALKLHIRDDLWSWEQIRADLRTEHAREPFSFVLVDYLQLIKTARHYERRQLAIAEITQSAKHLAKELECVLCMPSQVNKEGGTREAQDAENDADALLKICADADEDEPKPGKITVWKQRDGERHLALPLKFNSLLTRFEYQDQPEPEPHPNSRKR